MATDLYRASCLCGKVQLSLDAAPTELIHCHCRMCQKAHGALFATFARFPREALRVTAGEEAMAVHRSSGEARRTFCRECGAALQFLRDEAPTFGLAVSALDSSLEQLPVREYWADSKARRLLQTVEP